MAATEGMASDGRHAVFHDFVPIIDEAALVERNTPNMFASATAPPGLRSRMKAAASAEWRVYTEHPFTNGMADGLLVESAFRHYLVQDYLFLIEFARAYALSVYKAPKLADMREAAAGLSAILDVELNLHVKLCAGWGLSPHDLERAPPAVEMLAYPSRRAALRAFTPRQD